jgi:hypothetical protein
MIAAHAVGRQQQHCLHIRRRKGCSFGKAAEGTPSFRIIDRQEGVPDGATAFLRVFLSGTQQPSLRLVTIASSGLSD